jgi:hypothetical protein
MNATITPEPVTERWTAIGVRVGSDGKQVQAWLDATGTERWYTEKTRYVIGGIYQIEAVHKEAGLARRGTPLYLDETHPDEHLRAEWSAADHTATARLRALAAERKAKGRDPLDVALEPAYRIAAKCRTAADKDALTAFVIRRMHDAWANPLVWADL